MDPFGLKLRKLRKLNRESKARILGPNIRRTYGRDLTKDLEIVFREIDRIKSYHALAKPDASDWDVWMP